MSTSTSKIVDTINITKKIIETDNTVPKTIKAILHQNLQIISAQNRELAAYKNLNTIGAVRKFYSSVDTEKKNEAIEELKVLQKYLTDNKADLMKDMDINPEKKSLINTAISDYVMNKHISVPQFKDQASLIKFFQTEITGYSVLDEAFNGERADLIEEIQVNDYNDIRFIVGGQEERTDYAFYNTEHVKLLVDRLTREAAVNGTVEHLKDNVPFIRLRKGATTRISVMASPIATSWHGSTIHIAIRNQRSKPFTKEYLVNSGSISEYGDLLLETFACHGVSMAGYGGTGTGKTAMLRRYLASIQNNKRIITMAEIDEMCLLKVDRRKYLTHEDDPSIPEGKKKDNPNYNRAINSVLPWECTKAKTEITNGLCGFEGMINASLTFTPVVIVLQESKGGEIKSVIEEAISGHQVFTTIHANSPEAFFLRILLMYQQSGVNISDTLILKQIPLAFPVIVKFERFQDGTRKISEVSELLGFDSATQDPRFSTLLKYIVEDTITVEDKATGKPKNKVIGHFAVGDPISAKLKDILKHGSVSKDRLQQLEVLYKQSPKIEKVA